MAATQGETFMAHGVRWLCGLAAMAGCMMARPAAATLVLTGAVPGFTLTTAISLPYVNNSTYTLVSVGIAGTGNIIAPENSGPDFVYPDIDNQTLGGFIASAPLPAGNGFAMATLGGQVYGGQAWGGGYYRFNSNGSLGPALNVVGAGSWLGLWGDQANGKLLSSSTLGLIEIDPATGNYVVVNALAGFLADGVTVTPDGDTAYVADYTNDEVRGYSLLAANFGQQVFATASLGHGSDGMGVLAGTCGLAGQIVVNNNDGTVGLINPGNGNETVIASGGTRGDFVSADTNNGTLLLSQNDQLARLAAPRGCSIGSATAAPEPATTAWLTLALAGLAAVRWRRSRGGAAYGTNSAAAA